ncbi:MAG: hypothetical protein ACFE85_09555 [Candidatus Hodarchaeota archaeon]
MSWIKKQLRYLKDTFSQLIKGFLLFFLATSGLGIALLFRYLRYNGTIIAFVGIITEAVALILCYFVFRKYFTTKEETKPPDIKKVS